MEFKIYDYANKIRWCSIPEGEKPRAILVSIISGDETVVVFTDADKLYEFESSYTRFTDYKDGAYLLRNAEDIINWFDWEPNWEDEDKTYSYLRYEDFSDCAI